MKVFIFMVLCCLGVGPALSGEVQVLRTMKECERPADHQGFRVRVAVNADRRCDQDNARPFRFVDERLGITWGMLEHMTWTPNPVVVEPADIDPADRGVMCVRAFPDGTVLEWILPKGGSCERSGRNRYARRYVDDVVCIIPSNYCIAVGALRENGQRRALRSIELAKMR